MSGNKIECVRIHWAIDDLHITEYDVSYKSGRRVTYLDWENPVPKTVLQFISREDRVVLYKRDNYEVVG